MTAIARDILYQKKRAEFPLFFYVMATRKLLVSSGKKVCPPEKTFIVGVHKIMYKVRISMERPRILPFYMTYPLPLYYQQEDSVTRDLEYLQQMYPEEAKRYQKIIADILDHIDYEGSMIYDEYPDKWQIYRLTQIVTDKIKRQEEENAVKSDKDAESSQDKQAAGTEGMIRDWKQMEDFIQILLSYEIYRRRHTNHNGILKF